MKMRLSQTLVGHLATSGPDGRPHVVPICFDTHQDTLYFAVDSKPKRTTDLKRLKNIAANPAVSVLVDQVLHQLRAGIRGARGERQRRAWARARTGGAESPKRVLRDAMAVLLIHCALGWARAWEAVAEWRQAWVGFERHCFPAAAIAALRDFSHSSRPQEMRLHHVTGPQKNDRKLIRHSRVGR